MLAAEQPISLSVMTTVGQHPVKEMAMLNRYSTWQCDLCGMLQSCALHATAWSAFKGISCSTGIHLFSTIKSRHLEAKDSQASDAGEVEQDGPFEGTSHFGMQDTGLKHATISKTISAQRYHLASPPCFHCEDKCRMKVSNGKFQDMS